MYDRRRTHPRRQAPRRVSGPAKARAVRRCSYGRSPSATFHLSWSFMRSAREITFRLRQEAANALLAISSPNLQLRAEAPLPLLPDPTAVASSLRDSNYARELVA